MEIIYVCFMKKPKEEEPDPHPKCDEDVNVLVTNERLTDYNEEQQE